ncbi:hypothetical protein JCM10296v2_006713 [Rhodotorula toruloides]
MFVSAARSGVVGGLIGVGFLKLDGRLGLEGWRHLYIWEGVVTILIGLASIVFIADSPASAWYLSPRQKLLMRVRDLHARQYTGVDAFSWAEVRKAFLEPIKLALTEAEKEEQDRQGVTGDAHWSFTYVW